MKPTWLVAVPLLVAVAAADRAGAQSPPTQLSGVVVAPGPGPQVVASFPADGSSVAAGVLVLKIVFDQPMTPQAWAYGHAGAAPFPNCLARPRLLADRRTFALLCDVSASTSYAVAINPAPAFTSVNGRTAKPFMLRFSTTDTATRDMHTALTQAGLTDDDEPLMSWDDAGKGVSVSDPAAVSASGAVADAPRQ